MADDMGYECLSAYGSVSYKTPQLDKLAQDGIKFNNVVSQPLCTPSRVKIMTGKYNYRNYDYFGHLKTDSYTFGHMFKEADYQTAIVGKWQLNGLAYKKEILDWNDNTKPNKLGFDEYCLWQLTIPGNKGSRFANPLIEQNGKFLEKNEDDYGPDIFTNYILDFISKNSKKPFFVYYPMVLTHDPFVPTPDSKKWKNKKLRHKNDTSNFKDMVEYTDKIVGKIRAKLKELNIEDNTILIFTADNGTHPTIYTKTSSGVIRGAKGNTIDHGTHVPLIVSWPKKIKKSKDVDYLIEFGDFFATFSELLGSNKTSDGHSFLPLLSGEKFDERKTAFVHYDPRWNKRVSQYRNQFVRSKNYKLYASGKFYNLKNDIMEKHSIDFQNMSKKEKRIFSKLKQELSKHPRLNEN
jgi:arylsulfatase A-like enzyme